MIIALLIQIAAMSIAAQTNEFTYQGKLTDAAGTAATYDFQFKLCRLSTDCAVLNLVGTRVRNGVAVTNGVFSVTLDFPDTNFSGANRYLEIGVKPAGSAAAYTILTPRQQITSSPYSIKSLTADNATTATNSDQLGGVAANQFVLTTDPRLDGTNYIQNSTTQQPLSNFNVSGDGIVGGTLRAGILRATNSFNVNSTPVLSIAGVLNTFVGANAGAANSGIGNSFFGNQSGIANSGGASNSFFGALSGSSNTTGGSNSFFGRNAGTTNTDGDNNTVIGANADVGASNLSFATAVGAGAVVNASNTMVLGRTTDVVRVPGNFSTTGTMSTTNLTATTITGVNFNGTTFTGINVNGTNVNGTNVTGTNFDVLGEYRINGNRVFSVTNTNNTFAGRQTGTVNTGSNNSFFGFNAGNANTSAANNSFFGANSGDANTTGTANTFVGSAAGGANLTGNNNSFVGTSAGISNTSGDFNSFFGRSSGRLNTSGINNSFFGYNAGYNNTASSNSFFGTTAGLANTTGNNNSFFGARAGEQTTTGIFNTFYGSNSGLSNTNGTQNSYFGLSAGANNVSGAQNTYIGNNAGSIAVSGSSNTFVGSNAGGANATGSNNTLLGAGSEIETANISYATAIGAGARVGGNNTIVIGRIGGLDNVRIPGPITLFSNLNMQGADLNIIDGNILAGDIDVGGIDAAALDVQLDATIRGDLHVIGTITEDGNRAKKDGVISVTFADPLDPINKTLTMSALQSADIMNIFSGNIVTDGNGLAIVKLPVYAEALSGDFRYQLTVVGQFAQAIVFSKINGNQFTVKTDKPNVEVSWQVTGVRKVPAAKENEKSIRSVR